MILDFFANRSSLPASIRGGEFIRDGGFAAGRGAAPRYP